MRARGLKHYKFVPHINRVYFFFASNVLKVMQFRAIKGISKKNTFHMKGVLQIWLARLVLWLYGFYGSCEGLQPMPRLFWPFWLSIGFSVFLALLSACFFLPDRCLLARLKLNCLYSLVYMSEMRHILCCILFRFFVVSILLSANFEWPPK